MKNIVIKEFSARKRRPRLFSKFQPGDAGWGRHRLGQECPAESGAENRWEKAGRAGN